MNILINILISQSRDLKSIIKSYLIFNIFYQQFQSCHYSISSVDISKHTYIIHTVS